MISASALQAQANRNRRTIVDMIHTANAGHPGGSLSVIDVLTAIYATDVDLKAAEREGAQAIFEGFDPDGAERKSERKEDTP